MTQYTKKTLEQWSLDELTMMRAVKGRIVKKKKDARGDWVDTFIDATDAQWIYFCHKAAVCELDPLRNQIHWTPNATITGIDGFRSIADRTGRYVPGRIEVEFRDEVVIAAHACIKIQSKDGSWHDLIETAYRAEYEPIDSKGNTSNPIWRKMPAVMIKKCAEAIALRRAFPDQLAGLYTDDEIAQDTPTPTPTPTPTRSTEQPATREQIKLAGGMLSEIESNGVMSDTQLALLTAKLASAVTLSFRKKNGENLSPDELASIEKLKRAVTK